MIVKWQSDTYSTRKCEFFPTHDVPVLNRFLCQDRPSMNRASNLFEKRSLDHPDPA